MSHKSGSSWNLPSDIFIPNTLQALLLPSTVWRPTSRTSTVIYPATNSTSSTFSRTNSRHPLLKRCPRTAVVTMPRLASPCCPVVVVPAQQRPWWVNNARRVADEVLQTIKLKSMYYTRIPAIFGSLLIVSFKRKYRKFNSSSPTFESYEENRSCAFMKIETLNIGSVHTLIHPWIYSQFPFIHSFALSPNRIIPMELTN